MAAAAAGGLRLYSRLNLSSNPFITTDEIVLWSQKVPYSL